MFLVAVKMLITLLIVARAYVLLNGTSRRLAAHDLGTRRAMYEPGDYHIKKNTMTGCIS
jgi:hypothetical protein